jgi:hypothetical protein
MEEIGAESNDISVLSNGERAVEIGLRLARTRPMAQETGTRPSETTSE